MTNKYSQRITFYRKFWWPTIRFFELTPTQVLLMALIDGLSKHKGFSFAGAETLATVLNVSRPTVHANLKVLKSKGLIQEGWGDDYKAKLRKPTPKWGNFVRELDSGLGIEGKKFVSELSLE